MGFREKERNTTMHQKTTAGLARLRRGVLWMALLPLLWAGAARAAVPTVEDRAGLFSAAAVQKANQIVDHIYRMTAPAKEVAVETLATLPSGVEADDEAAQRFKQRHLNGLLVLIVKNPHKLALTVGRATEERFRGGESMRNAMLSQFKRGDYDAGLLAGLRLAEADLIRLFPADGAGAVGAVTRAERQQPVHESRGSGSWLWVLLLIAGGGGLILWLLHRRQQEQRMVTGGPHYGDGYQAGAPPQAGWGGTAAPTGGGGWVKPVVGGVAGAVAGNWLYDKFVRGDDSGTAHAAGHSDNAPSGLPRDDGDVGETFGGSGGGDDWGGSSLDADGGGGGDW
jgi:uncharacterized protein